MPTLQPTETVSLREALRKHRAAGGSSGFSGSKGVKFNKTPSLDYLNQPEYKGWKYKGTINGKGAESVGRATNYIKTINPYRERNYKAADRAITRLNAMARGA